MATTKTWKKTPTIHKANKNLAKAHPKLWTKGKRKKLKEELKKVNTN